MRRDGRPHRTRGRLLTPFSALPVAITVLTTVSITVRSMVGIVMPVGITVVVVGDDI